MTNRPIIAVVGATGAQGGGLARAILDDPESGFALRALTRKPEGEAARALAARGAEVVRADLDDQASLRRAFDGAHGAFCLTSFWEHFDPDLELSQARAMAGAARDAGVAHVVWSTLEDSRRFIPLDDPRLPTIKDRWKVPHFDAKGEADRFFADAGVPTTYLLTSFYWENFIHFGMGPRREPDGTLSLAMPLGEARFPGIAVEDIGRCTHGVFRAGARFRGERVGIAGEMLTGREMAQAMGQAMGTTVHYQAVPFDTYRALDFPGADDLGNMFQFNVEHADAFCAARSVDLARELNPALLRFEQWLAENHANIPVQ